MKNTNVLKKVLIGNPLYNLGLFQDVKEYNRIETAEQLAAFYHKMLNKYDHRPVVCKTLMLMISFSIGKNLDLMPTEL